MKPLERAGYLAHATTPSIRRRLVEARAVIAQALAQSTRPYVAFSTGKDSLVTMALVWEQAPNVPAVYFDADCAFPESYALLERLEARGYPLTRWPCVPFLDILAEAGGPDAPGIEEATMLHTVYWPIKSLLALYGYDLVFLGLRGEESNGRRMLVASRGLLFANQRDGILECLPVGRWRFRDVWAYIVSQGLDYNRVYDRLTALPVNCQRVSYWAGESERQNGRWVWLRETYPDLWHRFAQRFPEVARFT